MTQSQTITVRVSEDDKHIINHYSRMHGKTSSQLLKESALEKIEDDLDLSKYKKAMKEFQKDSTTYSVEEVDEMLGL